MKNQGGPDVDLRQRLLASGAELGLSERAVLEAEQQWLEKKKKEEELEEYRSHILRGLYMHLGVYIVVNMFLVLLNMMTSHGRVDWAGYVGVSWGIGIGCHLVAALVQLKSPGGEEFQMWKTTEQSQRSGVTVGVHIPAAPRPVEREALPDRNQTQA